MDRSRDTVTKGKGIVERLLPSKVDELPPPPKSVHDAPMTPEASAGFFSLLFFNWLTPLLSLGYARPLEAPDLYKLQDERASLRIANLVLESFERRRKEAQEYNIRLESGKVKPGLRAVWWAIRGNRAEREKHLERTLILAMHDSVKWFFWSAGVLKVISDTAQVTSPLVVKSIITFVTNSYNSRLTGERPPSIGVGIALAFTLLVLQMIWSWSMNHFFYRSTASGVLLRGGLITAIYSRSLNLTSRSRATLSNGRLVNHISTDVSRIDYCMGYFHVAWAAPIQLIVCLILLLINLGPSALAGFTLFVLVTPINTYIGKRLFAFRLKSMEWTDKRSKSLQEMLGGMKVIKFFAWEVPFLKRISYFRHLEMGYIRTLLILRAAMNAVALSLPVLASVIAFITHSLFGHPPDAATIFSSLTLFQLLRTPLTLLPMSISTISDAAAACERLYDIFVAETSDETLIHNRELDVALRVKSASFSWDSPPPQPEDPKKGGGGKRVKPDEKDTSEPFSQRKLVDTANVFQIRDVDLEIPRGQLVAIVGAFGVGKTSLLQGLTGEMRRTAGSVEFGGTVSYCAQSAWIQNASIRDNICFGRPFEEERYWKAVRDACLEADLQMLPNYDLTEVGEKGISLSGGQKQRINICRAIYCNTDIQIFDDPLSALDAHVGKDVFYNVLKSNGSGKTRILVTHALHFLPEVDFIYTVVDGRIAERGTYHELMANEGAFAEFIREFGSKEDPTAKSAEIKEVQVEASAKRDAVKGKGMVQEEERSIGAVRWRIYRQYLSVDHGLIFVPLLFLSLVLMEGANVVSAYWLMGIYAALGVSQTFTMFFVGFLFALLTYYVSQNLHERAIRRVLRAPMSFFETMAKLTWCADIDSIDNRVGDALRMLSVTAAQIIGAVILISAVLPWFIAVVYVVLVTYCCIAVFYRANAILRGSLYAHFSETLSGLTTIRAYGEVDRFKNENHKLVDIENRAYWLTVTNQRWLGIRLDLLGAALTFAVAILAVGTRFSISPGQTGLVLSYVLGVQQSVGWAVRQFAEVENNMNSVERVVHYADEVDQEAPHDVDSATVPENWPSEGRIIMNNVVMRYRPELPPVLKGLNMTIVPREKIGIVGRTGAGKSSIITALFRIFELSSGSIDIDGVNIAAVGLSRLRRSLSIIPQDAFLCEFFLERFGRTWTPLGCTDDARLWDALKRAYLVESSSQLHPIDEDGSNLSVGQRSLVSLARALVNDTKILIMDEATASIQDTIATEFRDRTIICIAHRLRTIISYDRICVLDAGTIAEFDTPANLYSIPNGIFRGMCERSSISFDDIINV
ncbi:ABC transporter [Pisolithus marmoratus]|nr:ABC transporter [Pisolithus marmoratus]